MVSSSRALLGLVALVAAVGCSRAEAVDDAMPVGLPARGRREALSSASFEGMLRVATPIRPPTSADGRVRIVTYVELPPGQSIDGALGSRASLTLPVGSYAARVEYLAPNGAPTDAVPGRDWRILDVRATRFAIGGEVYSVARPLASGGHGWVEWPKTEHAKGTTALVGLAHRGLFGGTTDAERARMADKLATINDCPSCHGPRLPANDGEGALVRRGTDASGLYTLVALFDDDGPYETYRPRDSNEGDPWITPRCGPLAATRDAARCGDGSRPRGHLDVRGGTGAGDAHALDVCASRRAFADRMSVAARALVADALGACTR